MDINENQRNIYNLHLQTYRRFQNKPYKLRENFDDFDINKPEEYLWLQKIDQLFRTHPQINKKLFFEAPYRLYEDQTYFSLNYYTSQKAIKSYTLYLKQINEQLPDNEFQLEFMKDSLVYIKKYCIEKKIDLVQYFDMIEQVTYSWAVHLAEHQVSPYVIVCFTFFNIPVYDKIFDMSVDERIMLIPEFADNYSLYKKRLLESNKAKKFLMNGIKLISENINRSLTTTKTVIK